MAKVISSHSDCIRIENECGFKFFADLLNAIDHENRTKPNSVAVSVDFIRVGKVE